MTYNVDEDTEFTIECIGSDGKWYVEGSERSSADAQYHMRRYQRMFPHVPYRVVGNPSRTIIVLHDPRPLALEGEDLEHDFGEHDCGEDTCVCRI